MTPQRHSLTEIAPRDLDSKYSSFPGLEKWSSTSFTPSRWESHLSNWNPRSFSKKKLKKALDFVSRAAATDTGALEDLYPADRGLTFTVAIEAATWEAEADAKGVEVPLIKSQIEAYDYVLDLATERTPIAESWIRQLHAVITKSQKTHPVLTEAGWQEIELHHGEYKSLPNHIIRRDGSWHAHAPVYQTPIEMKRFVEQLNSEAFQRAHPVHQSAYAHYCLVVIHPFADGNGRVARALASVFTYREGRIPFLVLADKKQEYLDVLSVADRGDFSGFLEFVDQRCASAFRMVRESMKAGDGPDPVESLDRIKNLYKTKGGYTHEEVDNAAKTLMDLLRQEVSKLAKDYSVQGQLTVGIENPRASYQSPRSDYRQPVSGENRSLRIVGRTVPPAQANVSKDYVVDVPKNCDEEDPLVVRNTQGEIDEFEATMLELVPQPETSLVLRLRLYAQTIVGKLLSDLADAAEHTLKGSGY